MGVGTDQQLIGQVKKLLDGALMIPSIQRGYVWSRPQIPACSIPCTRGTRSASLLIWDINLALRAWLV